MHVRMKKSLVTRVNSKEINTEAMYRSETEVCAVSQKIRADGVVLFFFFKQKTAYEMSASLVGSEMCIRDRTTGVSNPL